MKQFFLFFSFFAMLTVHATCPVDNNTVCTLSDSTNKVKPVFENQNAGTNIEKFSDSLNPLTKPNQYNKSLNTTPEPNYNTNCPFGNCMEKPDNKLVPRQN